MLILCSSYNQNPRLDRPNSSWTSFLFFSLPTKVEDQAESQRV